MAVCPSGVNGTISKTCISLGEAIQYSDGLTFTILIIGVLTTAYILLHVVTSILETLHNADRVPELERQVDELREELEGDE